MDDVVLDVVIVLRIIVGVLDGFFGFGDLGVFVGMESRDLWSDNVSKFVCERKELLN